MKLHLLRHGKTEPYATSGKDFDRHLVQKGIDQSKKMAIFLKSISGLPKHLACSTATRTKETYDTLQEAFVFETIDWQNELYLCSHTDLLKYIWSQPTNEDLFILGHNNGISDLAGYFTDEFVDLKTCGYIQIAFDCTTWLETSKGLGTIVQEFRPKVD